MLNDDFVLAVSRKFAKRIAAEPTERQVAAAYSIALGRTPTDDEAAWSETLVKHQYQRCRGQEQTEESARHEALCHLCQMLLNTSEFLYVH